MERLTERKAAYLSCDKLGYSTKVDYIEIKNKGLAEEKLCHTEDVEEKHSMSIDEMDAYITEHKKIEQEFGIDSITLFKALNGIYVFEQNAENEIVWEEVVLNIHNKTLDFKYPRKEIGKGRPLNMFGKTWALTKKGLVK